MSTDFRDLREHADRMAEDAEIWRKASDILKVAEDNKNSSALSEKLKTAIKANQKELERISKEITVEDKSLAKLRNQVSDLNDYLDNEYKKKKSKQDAELDKLKGERQVEIENSLENERKKLNQVKKMVNDYQKELVRIKAEIESIRSGLPV